MRVVRTVSVLILVAVMMTACTGSPGGIDDGPDPASSSGPATSADPTPSDSPDPETTAKVEKARSLAAQYDWDAALKLLEGDNSPAATEAAEEIQQAKAAAVTWPDNGKVSHLFWHSLIIDPERAFAPDEPTRQGYDEYMVTIDEFRAQLEQIHTNGYVLVHARRLVAPDKDGRMAYTPIVLPKDKKPLVVSVDDVSYYEYMLESGFASKLIVGEDGKVTNVYTDADGKTSEGAYDFTTVIDEFVTEHPDFSYRGDKGTIALTGYEGVFGYRTSVREYGDTDKTRSEQQEAKVVAEALRATGWEFASHSWGHMSVYTESIGRLQWDTDMWDKEVRPILGEVDQFIFAFGQDGYGSRQVTGGGGKYGVLQDDGFDYFFPIDSTVPSWTQLTPTMWRQMRIAVDGTTMRWAMDNPDNPLNDFFDSKSMYDPARP